jgi:hypothetical protein
MQDYCWLEKSKILGGFSIRRILLPAQSQRRSRHRSASGAERVRNEDCFYLVWGIGFEHSFSVKQKSHVLRIRDALSLTVFIHELFKLSASLNLEENFIIVLDGK